MKQKFEGPVGQVAGRDVINGAENRLESLCDADLMALKAWRIEQIRSEKKRSDTAFSVRSLVLLIPILLVSLYFSFQSMIVFLATRVHSSLPFWIVLVPILMVVLIKPYVERQIDVIVKHKKHLKRIEQAMMDRGLV